MGDTPFVHLHCHSDYSLLDGACGVSQLVNAVAQLGMPAVALTDHGNLFGAVHLYKAARHSGVQRDLGASSNHGSARLPTYLHGVRAVGVVQ